MLPVREKKAVKKNHSNRGPPEGGVSPVCCLSRKKKTLGKFAHVLLAPKQRILGNFANVLPVRGKKVIRTEGRSRGAPRPCSACPNNKNHSDINRQCKAPKITRASSRRCPNAKLAKIDGVGTETSALPSFAMLRKPTALHTLLLPVLHSLD